MFNGAVSWSTVCKTIVGCATHICTTISIPCPTTFWDEQIEISLAKFIRTWFDNVISDTGGITIAVSVTGVTRSLEFWFIDIYGVGNTTDDSFAIAEMKLCSVSIFLSLPWAAGLPSSPGRPAISIWYNARVIWVTTIIFELFSNPSNTGAHTIAQLTTPFYIRVHYVLLATSFWISIFCLWKAHVMINILFKI